MIRFFFILISIPLFNCVCYSQNSKPFKEKEKRRFSFINNENIKYSIVLISCDTCIPIKNIGYRVKVQLKKQEKVLVRKINSETWEKLLNNNKSDWAANLILYYIFDKDAFLLSRSNNRELWVNYLKSEDVRFWKTKLQKIETEFQTKH